MKNNFSVATLVAAFTDNSCKKILFDVKPRLLPDLSLFLRRLFNVRNGDHHTTIIREGAYEFLVFSFATQLDEGKVNELLAYANRTVYYIYLTHADYYLDTGSISLLKATISERP